MAEIEAEPEEEDVPEEATPPSACPHGASAWRELRRSGV